MISLSALRSFGGVRNRLRSVLGFENNLYEYVARLDKKGDVTFMNFGYAVLDGSESEPALAPGDEQNRYCIQLYHQLVAAARTDAVSGKKVLEIGCGRGGGADYIARAFRPRQLIALDLTEGSIEFCKSRHQAPNLDFVRGDAQALPFADAEFDLVLGFTLLSSVTDEAARRRVASEMARV